MLSTTIGVTVFVGVLISSSLIWGSREAQRHSRREEVRARLGPGAQRTRKTPLQRQTDSRAWLLGGLAERVHVLQMRAGEPERVWDFAWPTLVLAIFVPIIGFAWVGVPGLATAGVAALPWLRLRRLATQRTTQIDAQLPDALDIMSRALRAGHSFPSALNVAVEESTAPIQDELYRVLETHSLGLDLRECLRILTARQADSFDLRMFSAAVVLSQETGGNLVEIFENLSLTIRERVLFTQKREAMVAEVRTSAWILTALPFLAAAAVSLFQPGYLQPLLRTNLGLAMLIYGVASLGLGTLVMHRLAKVEV